MIVPLRSRVSKLAVTGFGLAVSAWLVYRVAFDAYVQGAIEGSTRESLERAVVLNPHDCEARYRLGLYYTFVFSEADAARGAQLLQQAAGCQPLRSSYWLALATALESTGRKGEAEADAERAAALETHNSTVLYQAGSLLLRMGRFDRAFSMFYRVLQGAPQYAEQVFHACWNSTDNGDLILAQAVPDSERLDFAYLNYLSSSDNVDLTGLRRLWGDLSGTGQTPPPEASFDQLDAFVRTKGTPQAVDTWNKAVAEVWSTKLKEASKVWERLINLPVSFEAENTFSYFETLFRAGHSEEAARNWDQLVVKGVLPRDELRDPGTGNLIVNGGLETDPLNGGLDWHIQPIGGVDIGMDSEIFHEGRRSLAVRFEGLTNLDFYDVSQYVPVKPNTRYDFRAFCKSRALTTLSGPHFEIYDYRDYQTRWKTEDVLGTTEWKESKLDFRTGPTTSLLVVRLRRTPAVELDKRIEGLLWIDDVSLTAEEARTQ